jgi:hypothetical protein
MITVQLLEDNDIIQATDWCRPMVIQPVNPWSDTVVFTNTYGGGPINNVKWLTAKQCCPYWIGKKLKDFNDGMGRTGTWYEFIRGDIPEKHQYGKTRSELRAEYEEYLKCNVMRFGKYKEKTFYEIKLKDDSYFRWAITKGMINDIEDY